VKRRILPVGAALVLAARGAGGADPLSDKRGPLHLLADEDVAPPGEEPPSATAPGYFNGLGSQGRTWEMQSDTAFSTSRAATQRFEIGGLLHLTPLLGAVVRTDFGAEDDTPSGFYSVKGPLVSLGARYRSASANHWVEFGVRFIPGWSGPHDNDPAALRLALDATLESAQADDAKWLPFASPGYQVYLAIQSRGEIDAGSAGQFLVGAHYGGRTSLSPLQVASWLGPQRGIVGNVFADLFFGVLRIHRSTINMQIGVHGEGSLSSVWPGDATFPALGDVFLGWSPASWVAARIFFGVAGVPGGSPQPEVPTSRPYGARVTFYLP